MRCFDISHYSYWEVMQCQYFWFNEVSPMLLRFRIILVSGGIIFV